ncbi:BioY family transporter (plasmid) [Pseudorhodobacter turbinis]|uniref:Biotin transporter n=1 Tax=Pseudorhodobacter turbinis TaxID=2500533 RepID=A0A4P8ELW4_9RHOB|nr:biotin transporter BioY [Pseudorhodobacter turbinis]QCO58067.1 BioY family transporter [Pseudorhodobacter turbinis]
MEKNVTYIALFAALIAVLGLVPQITLAVGVPVTAQSMGVMLCGTVLGAKRGGLAALLFIGLVALGLPLLSGGRGGLGVFSGPTVGFVVGFPIAAFLTGLLMEKLRAPIGIAAAGASLLGGVLVLYGVGITGMALVLGKSWIAAAGIMAVYLPGDLIKVALTGFITQGLAKLRPDAILSRH